MSMTKEQAIQAMIEGKKVTHRNFTKEEWMTMRGGIVILEDGVEVTMGEFFHIRYDDDWKEGYELWQSEDDLTNQTKN